MRPSQKVAAGGVIVVLLGLGALAAPAWNWLAPLALDAATPSESLSPRAVAPTMPEPEPDGRASRADLRPAESSADDVCTSPAIIEVSEFDDDGTVLGAKLRGEVKDLGPRPGANGILSTDRTTYTVVKEDNLSAIADRLCIGRGGLRWVNDVEDVLHVGQVLTLRP